MTNSNSTPEETASQHRFGQHPVVVVALAALVAGGAYFGVRLIDQQAGGHPDIMGLDPAVVEANTPPSGPNIMDMVDALENLTIPRGQILNGGPGKDGIPSISEPQFVTASEATFLQPESRVIGIKNASMARCYPLAILNYHECVNDEFDGMPVAVTYCPLCDSSLVFDRRVGEETPEFGVSGLLYNSNVLMYDRQAEDLNSLWSQMTSTAVAGDNSSTGLQTIPFEVTTWSDWSTQNPETDVLSTSTGHSRDYSQDPYEDYFNTDILMFEVVPLPQDASIPNKSHVVGVWGEGTARAYPLAEFESHDDPVSLDQELDGLTYRITYDPTHKTLRVLDRDEGVNHAYCLWFSWYAFHPDTEVYSADSETPASE